jgi:regulator of protease activity HflC (stomatin/prohibitin superfamily)
MQDFVFEKPSNPFVTKDNVPVDISVSILMKIKEPEGGSEAVY